MRGGGPRPPAGVVSAGALALLLASCSEPPRIAPNAPASSSAAPLAAASTDASSAAPATSASAPTSAAPSATQPPPPATPIRLATGGGVVGEAGAVTSVEANATKAGVAILEGGGNAVDAAVAVAFALAVTHPSAGNLGGGGFMIVRMADGRSTAIDFRETAPAASTTQKVLDEIAAGAIGWPSTAVPGTVAGLAYAREKYGTKPLADLTAPAAKLARGHRLSPRAAQSLAGQWSKLQKDPEGRRIFGKGKAALAAGDRLVQKDLARTLEAIGREGPAAFYGGPIATKIADAMKKGGGDVTLADLAGYRVKERTPLRFTYRGIVVETMPPPSMGGVSVAQILLGLERERARGNAPASGSVGWHHLFAELARRSYPERRRVGADPDFHGDRVPKGELERLLSPDHLARDWPPIDMEKATPSNVVAKVADVGPAESSETTHLSVIDAQGNAVSCTVTLSASLGAKVIAPGTGVLFSNALGAFSEKGPNEVAPGKRMASSMSPTLLSRPASASGPGETLAVVGSPGGDTIPGIVAQLVRNLVDGSLDVAAAGRAARVHHQWLPDELRVEKGLVPKATVEGLRKLGHVVVENHVPLGDAKLIVAEEVGAKAWAFADDREGGLALGAKN